MSEDKEKLPTESTDSDQQKPEQTKQDDLPFQVPKEPWTSHIRLVGLLVIVAFFSAFGIWSYFSPIESAAISAGKVTVAGSRRTIQHLEGGIVKKIYVKDGSTVKKGETLIKLDDTQAEIALKLARNEVFELLAIESRLIAERDGLDQIHFSERLLQNEAAPKVKQLMVAQASIFKANKNTFDGNLAILKRRITQLNEQILGTQAQIKANETQYQYILEELKSVRILEKKKLIEKSRLLSLEREAARLIGVRGEKRAEVAVLKQKVGETQAQILTLESNRMKETLDDLRETQQKLHDGLEKERSAEDIVKRTAIRSPQDGKVVGLKAHTVGGVIKPGEDIMDIVPSRDALIVEARVSPLDIDVVHAGLVARVQLTAFKQRSTPSLLGTVTDVSADIFQDQQTGQSYYTAKISIPPKELNKLKGNMLYPGMPAQVMIITDKRTPLEYFMQPIKDSFDRAFREQ